MSLIQLTKKKRKRKKKEEHQNDGQAILSEKLTELHSFPLVVDLVREILEFYELDYTLALFNQEARFRTEYRGRKSLATTLALDDASPRALLIDHLERASKSQSEKKMDSSRPNFSIDTNVSGGNGISNGAGMRPLAKSTVSLDKKDKEVGSGASGSPLVSSSNRNSQGVEPKRSVDELGSASEGGDLSPISNVPGGPSTSSFASSSADSPNTSRKSSVSTNNLAATATTQSPSPSTSSPSTVYKSTTGSAVNHGGGNGSVDHQYNHDFEHHDGVPMSEVDISDRDPFKDPFP